MLHDARRMDPLILLVFRQSPKIHTACPIYPPARLSQTQPRSGHRLMVPVVASVVHRHWQPLVQHLRPRRNSGPSIPAIQGIHRPFPRTGPPWRYPRPFVPIQHPQMSQWTDHPQEQQCDQSGPFGYPTYCETSHFPIAQSTRLGHRSARCVNHFPKRISHRPNVPTEPFDYPQEWLRPDPRFRGSQR